MVRVACGSTFHPRWRFQRLLEKIGNSARNMATLWIFGDGAPESIELKESCATIGRTNENTIRVKDSTISKRHARIQNEGGRWWLEDLGSVNGTWVRGERIDKPRRLKTGLRFKLGRHEFSLDESETEEDSLLDMERRGSIFMTLPAIPTDFLKDIPTIPFDSQSSGDFAEDSMLSRPLSGSPEKETLEERKLRLIRAVGEAVIEMTELAAVAEEILQIVADEIQADRAFLCFFADDGISGVPIASHGVEPDERVVFSRTVCREMLDKRAGVLIQKVASNADVSASLATLEIHSTVCVPLWTKDRIMGFLSLDITKSRRSFTKSDLEVLISVSHQAAIGIERARLSEMALQERKTRDYLCQYLDHKIVQSVLNSSAGEDPLAPREQQVTVMFCDIVSFTKISEGMPPSELAAFIHDHFTTMTEILFGHNGTVDKYIGDAVMALFGAPVADPLAPEFAVRAAVAMREHSESTLHPRIRLRFGISTGQAIVGNIGSSQRREYTAIGDSVNVASRLEGFARPDEIIIDETTAQALGEDFKLRDMGAIDVRNRIEPVRIFQVEPRG